MRIGYAEAKLEGDWAVFAKIAGYFVNRVLPDDREDFYQDLLVEMAKVKAKYEAKGKPLTEAGLMRVAGYELKAYFAKRQYRLFKLNCASCTIEQRQKCQTGLLTECPKKKAIQFISLEGSAKDDDGGEPTSLREILADKKDIDLAAWLDARLILHLLPKRLMQIGYKVYAGLPLGTGEKEYLKRWQLVHPAHFNLIPKRLFQIGYKIYTGAPLEAEEKRYLKRWQQLLPARFNLERDHPGERILELLRKKPQGVSRRDLATRLWIPVWELNWHLKQFIDSQQVIAVERENTRGRPLSPLFFIAGVEIPEEKKIKTPRDERIRQAYFIKGWSTKRIKRELHHDKRTIRRAIQKVEQPALV
jgi:hypothetical protein